MTYDVAVLGLGYVGLPLAQQATRAGLKVLGFDVKPGVVTALNAGRSHVDDLSDADAS
jgi:UDP-N-acetyl-D-glucosamine dehydrogenase